MGGPHRDRSLHLMSVIWFPIGKLGLCGLIERNLTNAYSRELQIHILFLKTILCAELLKVVLTEMQ